MRAGLIGLTDRLFDYRWSSYPWYAATAGRSGWFEPNVVLGELGLEDSAAGRRAYGERMRTRAREEREAKEGGSEVRAELRRGWCLASASFRERMLRLLEAAVEKLPGGNRSRFDGRVERDHGLEESRRILEIGLRYFGLTEKELAVAKKGDERKAAIAAIIRARTTAPNAWIAQSLHLGHVSRVSHCIRRATSRTDLRRALENCLEK